MFDMKEFMGINNTEFNYLIKGKIGIITLDCQLYNNILFVK